MSKAFRTKSPYCSLAKPEEQIDSVELHAFGDASGIEVLAVIRQPSKVSSSLAAAKLPQAS